jgi:hypothetical protein
VEAAEVGEGSVVEVGAKLRRGVVVGKVSSSGLFYLNIYIHIFWNQFRLSNPESTSLFFQLTFMCSLVLHDYCRNCSSARDPNTRLHRRVRQRLRTPY